MWCDRTFGLSKAARTETAGLFRGQTMPTAPPRHRPVGALTAEQAAAKRRAASAAKWPRLSAGQQGYDADWRACRKRFLEQNSMCVHPGCGKAAEQVDHIISLKERPDLRLHWSNLRALCVTHHSQRTFHDQGSQFGRGVTHPEWLQPSLVPVTLVCGPPASGKSQWVKAKAGPRDLVLDLDVIMAEVSRLPIYQAPNHWLDRGLRERNARLGTLSRSKAWPAAWLIIGEPNASKRQWWNDKIKPREIVVLETDTKICFDRIHTDPRRTESVRRRHCDAVVAWWGTYMRRAGDVVIR